MGILNITPDSFSDGGNYINIEKAIAHAKKMVAEGADIIDIGGESTRPNATPVSIEEELARVIPVIKRLKTEINIPLSIDTYKAEVAHLAVMAGAKIINDISGAKFDPDMPKIMAESGMQVILTHNRSPEDFGLYNNLISEMKKELKASIDLVLKAGVKSEQIILDPGIGFAKTIEQNIELMKNLSKLQTLGYPLLLGVSKKGTLRELMKDDDQSLLGVGTLATTCYAYTQGIDYIRVHDVKENKCAIKVMKNLKT